MLWTSQYFLLSLIITKAATLSYPSSMEQGPIPPGAVQAENKKTVFAQRKI